MDFGLRWNDRDVEKDNPFREAAAAEHPRRNPRRGDGERYFFEDCRNILKSISWI